MRAARHANHTRAKSKTMHPGTKHKPADAFRNEAGAFDLPSILIGVVVVGVLTAGVLATIFGIIPYTQDQGIRQDLSAVGTAQGVAKAKDGRFMTDSELRAAGYLSGERVPAAAAPAPAGTLAFERTASTGKEPKKVTVNAAADGSCFLAVGKSASGTIYYLTDMDGSTARKLKAQESPGCLAGDQIVDLIESVGGFAPDALPKSPQVTGAPTGPVSASFSWQPVNGATGYNATYRINAGALQVAAAAQTTNTVTVNAAAGDTVTVDVRAVNLAGSSAPANAAVTLIPAAPAVTGTATGPVTASFSWTAVNGATGYTVSSRANTGPWQIIGTGQTGTTAAVEAAEGDTVELRVAAVNAGGTSSPASASVSLPVPVNTAGTASWGYNVYGQLGNGAAGNNSTAAAVKDLQGTTTSISAAVGGTHMCAAVDGSAWCWGRNNYGQLGNGTLTDSNVPVKAAGELAGKTVTAVTTGSFYSCAIADGKAYCWGTTGLGELGNGVASPGNRATPVAVNRAVMTGTVTAITAGYNHACAIADGKAYCWGRGANGRLGNGSTTDRTTPALVNASAMSGTVTSISAGQSSTCAVATGKAYCWGAYANGRLGDGGVSDRTTPAAVYTAGVLSGKTVTSISTGANHACVIAGGGAYCWGSSGYGQLGRGYIGGETNVPLAVVGLTGTVEEISAGGVNTCAITDGTAYCWGYAARGSTGDGTTVQSNSPSRMVGLTGPVAHISAGNEAGILSYR